MKNPIWWNESSGHMELRFKDEDQITSIYHQGDCGDSTRAQMDYFVPQLEKYPEQLIIDCLVDAGFERDEMENSTTDDLRMRLVWMAAGDMYDIIGMLED